MRIHSIFYVLLLEKAPQNAKQQRTKVKGENEYEVKQILDYSQINGQTHYLVK
jgi:hypothetical protein